QLDIEDTEILGRRWALGLLVAHLRKEEDQKGNASPYGLGAMRKVCAAVGKDKVTILYEAEWLVTVFTREEVDRLMWLRMENDRRVSWSHIRVLLPVPMAL